MTFAKLGKIVAYILAVVLGGALIVGMFQPSKVDITASALVQAPPQAIYPLIADFKSGWTQWNAFDDDDPEIAYTYAGPAMGQGAEQHWHSKRMGNGRMTLVRADSANGVDFALAMGEGGKDFRLDGSIVLAPEGNGTRITWTDKADLGKNPAKRLMGPVMTKMMRKSLDKSLAGIKRLAETAQAQAPGAASAPKSP